MTIKYNDKENHYVVDTGAQAHVLTSEQTYTLAKWFSGSPFIPVGAAVQKARQIPGQPVEL